MRIWHDIWPELLVLLFLVSMAGAVFLAYFFTR